MKPGAPTASDPYLAWALATGLAGHSALAGRPDDGYLPLLLHAPFALADEHKDWRVPRLHRGREGSGFWTAWVPARAVDALAGLGVDCAMSLPLRDPPAKLPQREPSDLARADETDLPVIGVIDNGCAFLNRTFSRNDDPASSRFISLWRQRPDAQAAAGWYVPADFGYGLELAGSDMRPCALAGEAASYAVLSYPVNARGQLSDMLHGTHVLDIAAGRPQDLPKGASAKPAMLDRAGQARLVFVELPQPLDDDTTGAGLDAFILDAVHYIQRRAGPGRHVYINLSLGAQAGPHDGGSLVEQALDQLIRDSKGYLHICVAAGNGALEHWHASGTLRGHGDDREARAGWRTVPGDTTDSFLELWVSASNPAGLDGLTVALTAPDGHTVYAELGDAPRRLPVDADGAPQASLDLRRMPDFNQHHRACALISLAPTAGRRAGQAAGLWQVTACSPRPAEGQPAPECHVALWLQRDTPGRSLNEVLQSQFDVLSPNLQWNGRAALSHLAAARRVVTVGAARLSDGLPSRYSPRSGIDAWATADESSHVYGLLCSGGLSGSVFRISGTSAATPMVLRALANGTLALPPRTGPRPVGSSGNAEPGDPGTPLVWPDGSAPGSMSAAALSA